MKNPRGYTWQDMVMAGGLVVVLTLMIVVLTNPGVRLQHAYDNQRTEDVRDLAEIILEKEVTDPEGFAAIVGTAAAGRTMIGYGDDCSGSFGSLCPDDLLRDECFDLSVWTEQDIPVDPREAYSDAQTGYYIQFENQTLEIGACNPEAQSEVVIRRQF